MKSYLLIPFFLLVILGKLFGQSANWVFELEGEEESNISHVVQNGVGDYFVLGQCSGGSTNFGDIVFETLTNARTFFVAKITGSGELEWVKPIENSGASGNWDGEVAGFVQSEQDGSLYFLFECNDVNGDVYGGGEFGSFVLIKLLNTGELDWVEEFESNHLYKNYGVGINALRVNEIGNLEVSIFSPKNEQIHMVKNNLWLPENSSVHLEFSPSGSVVEIIETNSKANLTNYKLGDFEVISGAFSEGFEFGGESFDQKGYSPNGFFAVRDEQGVIFSKSTGPLTLVTKAEQTGANGFLLSGYFIGKDFIWGKDTLFDDGYVTQYHMSHNRFLIKIDSIGEVSWGCYFTPLEENSQISWVDFAIDGDEIVLVFSFNNGILYNGQLRSSEYFSGVGNSTLYIDRLRINSGSIVSNSWIAGSCGSRPFRPMIQHLNGKWILFGDYRKSLSLGGVSMVRDVEPKYFSNSFIMEFDNLTSMQESLNSMSNEDGLNPYANPSFGKSTIDVPSSFSVEPFILKIINEAGQLIEERFLPAGTDQLTLDLEGHPSGNYFVLLSNGTNSVTGKVVLR